MSDAQGIVVLQLSRLLQSETLSKRESEAGTRLLHRLEASVRLVLLGPDTATAEMILQQFQGVQTLDIGTAEVTIGGGFKDADIVLWCTNDFSDAERRAWEKAPNALKDHSFLVACTPQTHALPHLQDAAEEDFIGLFHLHSRGDLAELNALRHSVVGQIINGIQAVQDSAYLFVQKHGTKLAAAPTPSKMQPISEPKINQPQNEALTPKPSVFRQAVDRLSHHTTALAALANADETENCEHVFEACSAACDDLVDVFETAEPQHESVAAMRDTMFEAADQIMLMSLERNTSSAGDAVTVLLQIRKELTTCLAA